MSPFSIWLLASLCSCTLLASQGSPTSVIESSFSILQQAGNFTILLSLLRSTGIDLALEALEQVTFFAPSDEAFGLLPSGELGTLTHEDILDILRIHAVPSYLPFSALNSNVSILSFSGDAISFSRPSRSSVTVSSGFDDADVVATVVDQKPVAVYSIDRVLLPPRILARAAPVPAAIAAPPHSTSPSSAPVPLILAPAPSFSFSSDSSPAPSFSSDSSPAPSFSSDSSPAPSFSSDSSPAPAPTPTFSAPAPLIPSSIPAPVPAQVSPLSSILSKSGNFNTLVSLLSATGLDSTIKSLPALTLLAPSDQAFISLSKEVLRNLSDSQVVTLLKYHILPAFCSGFENVVNPLPTLASGSNNRTYLLRIQQQKPQSVQEEQPGFATIDTGAERAKVLGPLFVRSPSLAIFSVEKVLLPIELVGSRAATTPVSSPVLPPASAPSDQVADSSSIIAKASTLTCLIACSFSLLLF